MVWARVGRQSEWFQRETESQAQNWLSRRFAKPDIERESSGPVQYRCDNAGELAM